MEKNKKVTTKQERCPTQLLEDNPSQEDTLGGGHARTAQALADLVLSTTGGKAVALFGNWGSGKSTVVRLFQKEVEENPDTKVFVFDAWAHEGDPLRRSFLERLKSFLETSGWIKGKALEEINNQIDELTGRKEESQSRTDTVVTYEGKWIGASLALGVPLGAALLSSQPVFLAPTWFAALSLVAIFSPVLVATYFGFRSRPRKRTWEFPSLVSQNIHTTRTSTVRSPEPTSVEFEARFKDMLDRALTGDRRLVIVVDNLDRLPNEQARSVWATMRTFFEVRDKPWSHRLWVIVPADPSAVPHLWLGGGDDAIQEASEGNPGRDVAEVFVSKFFQARFYVPPPVLSDWKPFFFDMLGKAFPSHDEEDFYPIYRVYRDLVLKQDRPPTPRSLKQFVNLIGSQHRTWQDEIPLPLQALYVALREELAKNPRQALTDKEPEVRKIFPEAENWKAHVLSQHFNVAPEKALQVLFLEDIRKGLDSATDVGLKEVAELLEPKALATLLGEALAEAGEWVNKTPERLARSALAIHEIRGALPDAEREHLLSQLRARAAQASEWAVWDNEVAQGLLVLIASASTDDEKQDLVRAILNGVEVHSGNDEDGGAKKIANTATYLADFLNQLKDRLNLDVPDGFHFPVQEPADWIPALSAIDPWGFDEEIKKPFFPTPSDLPKVLNELATRAGQGTFGMIEARAVRALSDGEPSSELSWQGLINNLDIRLATSEQYPDGRLRAMMYALLQLEPIAPRAKGVLDKLVSNWFLFHHLSVVEDKRTLATLLLPLIALNPAGQFRSQGGQANQGLQKFRSLLQSPEQVDLKELARILIELAKRGSETFSIENVVQAAASSSDAKKLVVDLLDIVEQEYPGEDFYPDLLLEHGDSLSELLEKDALGEKYRKYQRQVIERMLNEGFDLDRLPLYERLLQVAEEPQLARFGDLLRSGFEGQTKDVWLDFIRQGDTSVTMHILRALDQRGFPPHLDHKLADAIEDAAASLLHNEEGEYDPSIVKEYWKFLDDVARRILAVRLAGRISELLIENREKSAEEFLEAAGDEILYAVEKVKPEDLNNLLLAWLPKALQRLSKDELEWLVKLFLKLRDRVPSLNQDVLKEALERIEAAHKELEDKGSADEGLRELLTELRNRFGQR
ncbi:P-loop NTPase fold protein [Oceanithermus desulfurans]|nr:P-loop NTPase fold protein [Oceanithermus desulfurans]MBB6030055.1 energy-coupling factor transporter ATP-binding protein EcfA2 [Oceanithermus desulfurans]